MKILNIILLMLIGIFCINFVSATVYNYPTQVVMPETSGSNTENTYGGMVIEPLTNPITLVSITKGSGSQVDTVVIQTKGGCDINENLSVATFVGDVATLPSPLTLSVGTNYFITATKTAGSFAYHYANGGEFSGLPYYMSNESNVDYDFNMVGYVDPSAPCLNINWANSMLIFSSFQISGAVSDTNYPIFSSPTLSPANNSAYILNGKYQFNTTIDYANGTAGIEFNGVNYSMTQKGKVFNISFSNLGVNNYSYYFWAYGNGTSTLYNSTAMSYYSLSKAPSYMYLYINNSRSNFVSYNLPFIFSVNATLNDSLGNNIPDMVWLWDNGVSEGVNANSPVNWKQTRFAYGNNFVSATFNGNQNYTDAYEQWWVNDINPAPIMTFLSQLPLNITSFNVYTKRLNITYNITAPLGLAKVDYYSKTNETATEIWQYINGTETVEGYLGLNNRTGVVITNLSSVWNAIISPTLIYPSVFNLDPEVTNLNIKSIYTLNTLSKMVKTRFFNLTKNSYGTFNFMANSTGGTSSLRVYFCNDSYTNDLTQSCGIIATFPNTQTFNYTVTNNSAYNFVPFVMNVSEATIAGVKVTNTNSFILRKTSGTGNWNVYYDNIVAQGGTTQTWNSGTGSWDEFAGTANTFVSQYTPLNYTNFYYVCANDTAGNYNCSSVRSNPIIEQVLNPTIPRVYSPAAGNYKGNIAIKYTSSESGDYPITYYNISLVNANDLSFNKTIIENNSIDLNYTWDSSGTPDGNYTIRVTAYNTLGYSSNGYSNTFTLDNYLPIINITYPINNYYYNYHVTQLNYSVSVVSGISLSSCWYSIDNGITNISIICGNNVTLVASEGINYWTVGANDSINNVNESRINFVMDTTYPLIDYGEGTLPDGSNVSQDYVYINTTWTESNFNNMTFRLNDLTQIYTTANFTTASYDYPTQVILPESSGAVTQNTYTGIIIEPLTSPIVLSSITKDSGEEVDTVIIQSPDTCGLSNLSVANFVGDTATLSAPLTLSIGTKYYILATNTTGDYKFNYANAGEWSGYPYYMSNESNPGYDFNLLGYIDPSLPCYEITWANLLPTFTSFQINSISQYIYDTNFSGLTDGYYAYNVSICDLAGNCNMTSTRSIFLETSNPNASLISPLNGTYANTAQNFTANLSDAFGIKNATLNIYNSSAALIYQATITFAKNTLSAATGIVVILADDVYNWFYQTFNWAGNSYATDNNTITINTIPPTISITYPISGNSYNYSVTTMNYTITSKIPLSNCWFNNGTDNTTVTCGNNITTNLSPKNGLNTWSVYANDSAGNVASAAMTFNSVGISECLNFTSSGNYNLVTNLALSSGTCLSVQAPNVKIDCGGHSIIVGNGVPFFTDQTGTTINNCIFDNTGPALNVSGGSVTVTDSTLTNSNYGILATAGSVNVLDSTISGNQYGIYMTGPATANLNNVTFSNNQQNIFQANTSSGSVYNNILFSGFSGTDDLINLQNSNGNTFTRMIGLEITDTSDDGLIKYSGSSNNLMQTCNYTTGETSFIVLHNNSVNNAFLDCYYQGSETVDTTSQLLREWSATVTVNDTSGYTITGSTIYYGGSTIGTNSNGVANINILQYINNGTITQFNPYEIYGVLSGYGNSLFTNHFLNNITGVTKIGLTFGQQIQSTLLTRQVAKIFLAVLLLIGIAASCGWFIVKMRGGESVSDIWRFFIIMVIWDTVFLILFVILSGYIMKFLYPPGGL